MSANTPPRKNHTNVLINCLNKQIAFISKFNFYTQQPYSQGYFLKKLFLFSLFILSFTASFADDVIWTGAVSNSWHNNSNWQAGQVPTGADIAVFKGTSNVNSVVSSNVSVGGVRIESTYYGVVSQSGGGLTVGSFGYFQSGGTFLGGSVTSTVNGYFDKKND